jgi:GT2 family glycosyltransferase
MTLVSAIVVAYGESPWLHACVDAVLQSTGVDVEVIVVDNGAPPAAALAGRAGVEVVRPTTNTGFAGGCNAGVAASHGEVVALVNPDAIVEPDALARLVAAVEDKATGIATASLRLADAPDRLNSAGNEVHFLGFGWVGAFNEPAASRPAGRATAASGAAMALRREVWDQLGGFDDEFFMYQEDADLSLRCWQRGLEVRYVPGAVVLHHYEFGRHPAKLGLLERNRLVLVLTLYQRRTLLLLLPPLLAVEVAMVALAVVQGWAREKVRGWAWLARHRGWLRDRRRRVQAARVARDRDMAELFATRLDPANYRLPGIVRPVELPMAWYWAAVRRLL